jgi:hypothetical protein
VPGRRPAGSARLGLLQHRPDTVAIGALGAHGASRPCIQASHMRQSASPSRRPVVARTTQSACRRWSPVASNSRRISVFGAPTPPHPATAELHLLFSFVTTAPIALGRLLLARRLVVDLGGTPGGRSPRSSPGCSPSPSSRPLAGPRSRGDRPVSSSGSRSVASLPAVVVVGRLLAQARSSGGEVPAANGWGEAVVASTGACARQG